MSTPAGRPLFMESAGNYSYEYADILCIYFLFLGTITLLILTQAKFKFACFVLQSFVYGTDLAYAR